MIFDPNIIIGLMSNKYKERRLSMKKLKKPTSKRTENLNKVRIHGLMAASEPGSKYQGCQNPRGCGCAAC